MLKLKRATISGAYGRDYQDAKGIELDFFRGKDFMVHVSVDENNHVVQYPHGVYCSVRDFAKGAQVTVRFNRLGDVHIITV